MIPVAGGAYAVVIDGRPARTPEGRELALPSEALARAVADEWRAQGETIDPLTMPLTRLASTAMDRVGAARRGVIDQALEYAGTDLLCYRAEEPAELAMSQQMRWQPLIDWAADAHCARLRVTAGVSPVAQPKAALRALRASVEALDDMEISVLSTVTAATGSLIVALALLDGRIGADEAFETSQVDESFRVPLPLHLIIFDIDGTLVDANVVDTEAVPQFRITTASRKSTRTGMIINIQPIPGYWGKRLIPLNLV